jgi:hypothetical protein
LKCRSKIIPADTIIIDLISSLKFYCKNSMKGCKKLLFYDEIEKHHNSCYYEKVSCPNDYCSHETLKVNLHSHLKKCDFQKICPYCKKTVNSQKFPFHRMVCNLREVKCKMCSKNFTYKKYEKHKEECKDKYWNIVNELSESNVICENCYENDELVHCQVKKMIGCYLCKLMYCEKCYFLNSFCKCNGCGEVCCQSHLINCRICNMLKCSSCLKNCSECYYSGICDGCLYTDENKKTYCKNCRKCYTCNKVSVKNIERKCYICNEEKTCDDCTTISSFSEKTICKTMCISCNKCDYRFHDLEIIRTMIILKSVFKRKKVIDKSGLVGQFMICNHIYSTYKPYI